MNTLLPSTSRKILSSIRNMHCHGTDKNEILQRRGAEKLPFLAPATCYKDLVFGVALPYYVGAYLSVATTMIQISCFKCIDSALISKAISAYFYCLVLLWC